MLIFTDQLNEVNVLEVHITSLMKAYKNWIILLVC